MGILRLGDNCWRTEPASRAAVLIDAAAYFAALRDALCQARHSVFIVGWDLDSRTKLAGENCAADDGWPLTLREFLICMVEKRPELTVYLLAWDFAILYALERDPFPSLKLGWQTPDQIRFRLDNVLPAGASHHQKIIVVDDALAFSGGLDLAVRRWDTSLHHLDDPHRRDPSGKPYPPFHDVQMVVDGDAARALAELVHERWQRATGEHIPIRPAESPWPNVAPDFHDVQVSIARTLPACNGQEEVREVEALFADMIASAEREIYIENQFLTCTAMAKALAQRLRANSNLQALLVAPHTPENWFEYHTMRNGRIQFLRALSEPGVSERVRLMCPEIRSGQRVAHTMVHSKVMIVDDRILRVGSANLNNRSMGTDTECDLVVEAKSDAEHSRIRYVRARLLADHCGVSVEQALSAAEQSLIAAADTLSGRGHRLVPIEDGEADEGEFAEHLQAVADPERPIESDKLIESFFRDRLPRPSRWMMWAKLAAVPLLALALAIAWQFPPLSHVASPAEIGPMLNALAEQPWAPLLVIGVYVVGGLVAFPVLLLIAATAAAFGPVLGFLYAAAGSLASATVTYALGFALGRDTLRAVIGPRLKRVQRRIVSGGVVTIAAIRLVPIAPFTVVNIVAGASDIRLGPFIAGTILGMAPGWMLMSALGHQIARIATGPTAGDIALLAMLIIIWISLAATVQLAFAKFGRRG
ncbi:MAG: VTT domain-containing protein [Xanthobacteraceae bacterium]